MAERGVIFKDDFVSTPNKSWFDMSYDYLFSMNFGELVPNVCVECMPDDVLHEKTDSFVRLAPLVAPTFGKVNMFNYHFYVRNRDIWTNWQSFITNTDIRQSWQQSLSTTFVSPEAPYVDVHRLINAIFGEYSVTGQIEHPMYEFNDPQWYGEGQQDTDMREVFCHLAMSYPTCLVVERHDGQWLAHIDVNYDGARAFVWDEDDAYFIFPFVPNKDELGLLNRDRKISDPGYIKYYNPFSNGSLLDYLGVDFSAYYKKQAQYIRGAFDTFMETIESEDVPEGGSNVYFPYWPDKLTPFQALSSMDEFLYRYQWQDYSIGFDGDLMNFLESHYVLGMLQRSTTASYWFGVNGSFHPVTDLATSITEAQAASLDTAFNSNYSKLMYADTDFHENQCINTLPIRAYQFIYSEYFRDENYIGVNTNIDFTRDGFDIDFNNSNVQDIFDYYTLRIKAYEHDPYTTALPSAQKGEAVRFLPDSRLKFGKPGDSETGYFTALSAGRTTTGGSADFTGEFAVSPGGAASTSSMRPVELSVDLSAATIENFRFANATQRYLEKVARSGSRYYEYMKAIFGSDIPSEKLNRPVYLGGDKSPIQVSEVIQTSASELNTDQPLGQMAGRAVTVGSDDYLEYVCPDHGFFISVCSVLPRTNYQSGINPMFTRRTYLDYPIPEFSQLGEEPVLQRELWSTFSDEDLIPFGYQSRYYQFKYNRDRTAGTFKDQLDYWTWSRKFDNAPVQGREFIEVHPDYRQFAVIDKSSEHVYCHFWHDLQINRVLPVFGMPSL